MPKTKTTVEKVVKTKPEVKVKTNELVGVKKDHSSLTVPSLKSKEEEVKRKPSIFLDKQEELTRPVAVPTAKRSKKRLNTQSLISPSQMRRLIAKPYTNTLSNLLKLVELKKEYSYRSENEQQDEFFRQQNEAERALHGEISDDKKQAAELTNIILSHSVIEDHLPKELAKHNVKKVLILTDTEYYQNTKTYSKLIRSLKANGFKYAEYTNIQPNLNKGLVWKIVEFARKEGIDSLLAFGSWSTVDLSKIVTIKLTNPRIIRLNRVNARFYSQSNYLVFSLPTVVCMDDRVNSRSLLRTSMTSKERRIYSDSITLFTPADNSDCSFFYPDYLFELSKSKLLQVLYESYFRSVLNFFDYKLTDEISKIVVEDAKLFHNYARLVHHEEYQLTPQDADKIGRAIVRTVDGTTYLSNVNQWRWFSIESGLSGDLNSKKSDGLALFAPNYLQNEAKYSKKFAKRALLLASWLYGRSSIEGLTYEMMRFNEEFGLPKAFFDIKEITKINPKILLSLTRKGSYFIVSYQASRAIVRSVPIY